MGASGSKGHEAFTVTPAATADAPPLSQVAPHLEMQLLELDTLTTGPDPANYGQLCDLVGNIHGQLGQAPPDVAEAVQHHLHQAANQYLSGLDDAQLQQLAATEGFEHPTLIGLNTTGQHPLVHWLDPTYPPGATKAALQAKASQRWQQLAAGATINGWTHADVAAAEAALHPAPTQPDPEWIATPEQVSTVMAQLTTAAASLPATSSPDYPAKAAELLALERQLHTARCDELGDSLHGLQASSALLTTASLAPAGHRRVAKHLLDSGTLPPTAAYLAPSEALAVARSSTAAAEIDTLNELASQRAAQVQQLAEHTAAGAGSLDSLTTTSELQGWVSKTAAAAKLRNQIGAWSPTSCAAASELDPAGISAAAPTELTAGFRKWAKTQKLADLRAAAGTLGLEHAGKATRTQIQNYLASHWDTGLDTAGIQAKVAAKVKAPTKTKLAGGSSHPAVATAAKAHTWLGTLGNLKAKLKAKQQLAAELPPPPTAAAVTEHDWGKGTPFSKGSHESSVHTGPDGGKWMFKPDKSANGARAHAEAAATSVYRSVGVPGPTAHVASIGGRTGTVQPLVAGASTVEPNPSGWSQNDIDSIVQLHVAAWAVGDHDAHHSNVMRSPSGAIFAVDQGQAFKFFGRDRLDATWKPQSNHGQPVYAAAYQAHKQHTLGAGVSVRAKAALPVIKAFEAIDDDTYRTMLAPTASEGVKHGVSWVRPMREAAAKRHGTATPTDQQVVDEFLDHAVERKARLRTDFADLYAGLDVEDADHLTWVR